MAGTTPVMHLTWTCVSDSTFDAYSSAGTPALGEALEPTEALELLEGLLERRTGALGEAEESGSRERPYLSVGGGGVSEATTVERIPLPPRRAEAFLDQVLRLYE